MSGSCSECTWKYCQRERETESEREGKKELE